MGRFTQIPAQVLGFGMINAAMTPIAVYLGAVLVNRIAEASSHKIPFSELVTVVIGLWVVATLQRTISAYMGYGRNLFVRRVELEAEEDCWQRPLKLILEILIIRTGMTG